MEQEIKEHWISKVTAIRAKDIFELANSLNKICSEKFVVASPAFKTENGYECLVYYKVSPQENMNQELGIKKQPPQNFYSNKPTEKQLRFLRDHKFKIEPNLTKNEATTIIKEYLDRINKEKPKKQYEY